MLLDVADHVGQCSLRRVVRLCDVDAKSLWVGWTSQSSGDLRMRSRRILTPRWSHDSGAHGTTEIGHHAFQQRLICEPVVDTVHEPVMYEIRIDTPVERPVGVDRLGEFGSY